MMTSLLSLPNELLQHVACFLSCSDILRVSRVNRQLHHACHDRLVYYHIAKNLIFNEPDALARLRIASLEFKGAELTCAQLEWTEGELLLEGASLEQTIRVALAVERCLKLLDTRSDTWKLCESESTNNYDFSEWLPQLLAFHHPATLGLRPGTFLQLQHELSKPSSLVPGPEIIRIIRTAFFSDSPNMNKQRRQELDLINVNFIITYITLSQLRSLDQLAPIGQFLDYFFPERKGQSFEATNDELELTAKIVAQLSGRVPGYSEFGNGLSLLRALSALPVMLLKLVVQVPIVIPLRMLPRPEQMRFHTFMKIPEVFNDHEQAFSSCHISTTSTPKFLSGKWFGCYTDERLDLNRNWVDPPLYDISIISRSPNEEEGEIMDCVAIIDDGSNGFDSHGHFTLAGHVRKDGFLYVLKRYTTFNWTWTWEGQVTPFGLVGAWGHQNSFGGYFWIWKEEWC